MPSPAAGAWRRTWVYERAKRAAQDLGEGVSACEINASERSAVAEFGRSDAVIVDGKNLRNGPPPSYEAIRNAMAKRLRKR